MGSRRRRAARAPLSVERLESDERCPDQTGFVAELGLDDPERLVGGLDRLGPCRDPRRLEHEVAGSGAEAASDDDDIRVEDVDERTDRGTEQPADLGECRHRAGIPGSRALDQDRRICPRPEERGSRPVGCEPGRVRLEMPAAVAVPLAGLATRDHDRVAELRPAAVEMIVDDEPSTDSGPEREHDQIRRPPPRLLTAIRRARQRCRRSRRRREWSSAPAHGRENERGGAGG